MLTIRGGRVQVRVLEIDTTIALILSIWFKLWLQRNNQTIPSLRPNKRETVCPRWESGREGKRCPREQIPRTSQGDLTLTFSLGALCRLLWSHPQLAALLLLSASRFCCRQGVGDPLAIFCFSQDRLQVYFIYGAPLRGKQFIYLTQLEWRNKNV